MSPTDEQALTGTIFDESVVLTVKDLSRMCAVEERHIVEFVDEGVLHAVVIESEWRFNGAALRRARLALRLERDMELNLAGVALALDLIEEIERLRRDPSEPNAHEAKRAFLFLVKRHHPDQGGSHQAFLQVKDAYDRAHSVLRHAAGGR